MEHYTPIGITAGIMMLKWDVLNQHLHSSKTLDLKVDDNVNIFINFEGVLENLSLQRNLHDLVSFHKQKLVIDIEAAILNLMANYRMYFHKERCHPKLYFYYTDLSNEKQQMEVYNKYYRSYYKNRYIQNPQFREMGKLLIETIIPEIELILSYIPDCYFIKAKSFDGSLIPKIIANNTGNKNIIISQDIFDTLYLFDPNFSMLYLRGKYGNRRIISDLDETIESVLKGENPIDMSIFRSEMYYRLLLSIKGSRIRNIRSASGFGYGKFITLMKKGITDDIVLKDFESIDSIIELFPDKYREDIKSAFQCTGIEMQYSLLSEADIDGIEDQIIDKVDIASLEALNNKRFFEFPINLQGLLG